MCARAWRLSAAPSELLVARESLPTPEAPCSSRLTARFSLRRIGMRATPFTQPITRARGVGTEPVAAIARRLGGMARFEYDEEAFHASAMPPSQ